jgi:putative ABC transport system permease protein
MVAALVALTTMTRMVEEQRIQLGTFKALGYSNAAIAAKYLLYAGLATLLGSAVGLCVGMKLFPAVIWNAYSMMYNQPPLVTPFRWNYAIITFAASLACTMLAAFGACRHSLQECSASLMLPKAPKPGKRVLLERITPLWKHMKFTHKVTVRNLLRYKKRFFMTIVGIAGCTALLLTGFGLSNSINDILDKQYGELNRYDMLVMCKDGSAVNDDDLQNALAGTDCQVAVHQESCDITADDKTLEAYLFVPEDTDMLSEVLTLRERKSGNPLTLSDDSIILTEKAAETMGLSVGDTLTLQRSDGDPVTLTVGGIAENYVYTYVYMTPEQYERLFGMSAEYQVLLVTMSGMDEEAQTALGESVLDCENVSMITLVSSIQTSFRNMVVSIDYIVLVLIICAGLLAFVVLYNLMNINITERQRELATIKVLGFYEGEVGAYVYRETLILSLLGTALGLFLGIFLHAFVVRTAEVDVAMFGRDIYPMSFVYAALLTMLFSVLVCLVMFPKLRKIDMVESLKSIE